MGQIELDINSENLHQEKKILENHLTREKIFSASVVSSVVLLRSRYKTSVKLRIFMHKKLLTYISLVRLP